MNPVWHILNGVPQLGPIAPSSVLAGDGTASAPSYSFASDTDLGFWRTTNNVLVFAANGSSWWTALNGQILLRNTTQLDWASGDPTSTSADVSLSRGAANRLDLATGDSFRLVSGVLTGGGLVSRLMTVTTEATAAAVTYSAAALAGGLILRNTNGANRADLVPTAANLLAAIPGAQVGQAVEFAIRNTAGAAETITLTTNTGMTMSGTMTIAQNNTKKFVAVFTNVTAASEAATVYSLGTVVH